MYFITTHSRTLTHHEGGGGGMGGRGGMPIGGIGGLGGGGGGAPQPGGPVNDLRLSECAGGNQTGETSSGTAEIVTISRKAQSPVTFTLQYRVTIHVVPKGPLTT